ncbi:MAG: SRPBCC family protein [Pseudomonadota bacterium]
MTEPIIKTIEVPCPPSTAFDAFTRDIGTWWPKESHSVSAMDGNTARAVTMEPHVGGSLTETGHDGTIHHWGSVKVFKPGEHLQLAWHINAPESEASTVDVTFTKTGRGTRVELKHHNWENLGDRADDMRDGYNKGWVNVFEVVYAGYLTKLAA